jgi:hypothetical protein
VYCNVCTVGVVQNVLNVNTVHGSKGRPVPTRSEGNPAASLAEGPWLQEHPGNYLCRSSSSMKMSSIFQSIFLTGYRLIGLLSLRV